jgi:hypothetical protein
VANNTPIASVRRAFFSELISIYLSYRTQIRRGAPLGITDTATHQDVSFILSTICIRIPSIRTAFGSR